MSDSIANGGGCRPCKQVQLNVTDAILHFVGDGSALSHLNASNVDFGTLRTSVFPVSGVTAGTYGSSSNVSQVTVDQYGRVLFADNVAITSSQWTGQPGSTIYYIPGVSIGSSNDATANLQVTGNVYVSNAITTTNVFATRYYGDGGLLSNISTFTQPLANLVVSNSVTTTNVFATRYYGDGGLLSNISSSAITQPFANLVVSNAVTTTNVFATRYYGDGGLLSNISSSAITQPFANLVVSNAVTTTNVFTNNVTATGIQTIAGLTGLTSLNVSGNVFVSNAVTTTNVFATRYYGDGGQLSNISSSAITQPFANLVVSNSVTTTNVFATGTSNLTNVNVQDTFNVNGSMTANAANATFFFDTFTIPYINTQDLNVSSVMNFTGPLATLANLYVPGNANIEYLSVSNLAVTGNLYITATNVQTTNALTINNSGTMTALKVTQNETSIHTHNVAEFWDATTLAMVIDPEGNVGIHTTSSPGYALTVTGPANFETLYIRGNDGLTTLNVNGNVYVSNAVTTTNVFATRYYGDGGLLSNISSSAITQPFANLVVSNAVTTTNVFTNNVTATGIQTIAGLTGLTSLNVTGNVFVSNAVTTTNLFTTTANVGTLNVWQVSNLSTLSLTNNLYSSNAVTTTNLFTAGITSNVTATTFNYDTITVPFVSCTTINVSSTSNLQIATITGTIGQTSLNVTGNIYASNAITATNVFASGNISAGGQVTSAGRTGVGVCGPVVFRQGAAGANWNTPAANTSTVAVTSGAVQIQCGANVMTGTTQFIPFPVSYTGNPIVLITSYGITGNIWVASITTTAFSVSANAAVQFEWMSIGI